MNEISAKMKQSGIGAIKIWYLLTMLHLSSSMNILIAQNDKYKDLQNWIEEVKSQFEPDIEWHQCNYSAISEHLNMHPSILIIFDLSDDIETQLSISQICKESNKIHLVMESKYDSYYDEWTYSILPSKSVQMDAYFSVLNYFNWNNGLVINDENNFNCKYKFLDHSNAFDYLTVESSSSIEKLVNRIIKPLGLKLYYIFAETDLSLKIQESLKLKKLLLNGDGIILNQQSGYGCIIDGALIITPEGQEYKSSQDESLSYSAKKLLEYLLANTIEPATIEGLRFMLEKYKENNQFSIVNIKNSKREIVGSVSDGIVSIMKNITFPGNTNTVPKSEKKNLHVTVSGGSTNPGTPPVTSSPLLFTGSYTAWSLINDGTLGILKNFQISHFIFDCGALNYDEKFARPCFTKDIDQFGLAHISPASSPLAMAEMKLFKSLNVTVPIVGPTQTHYALSSTALYPWFTRITISALYIITLDSLTIKALGWNKINVIYYNDSTWSFNYLAFAKSAEQYNLEILNPESSRAIPVDLNRTNIKDHAKLFQALIDTQARFFVFLITPPWSYYVLEELYDRGLRKGDIFTVVPIPDYLTMFQYDNMYTYKIKETGAPMMSIAAQNWVGKVGQFAYSKIASLYNIVPYPYSCNCYDAAYYIAAALDYVINQGLDYDDPYQMNSALRVQKFTGCTGTVSIDKTSNDRIADALNIMVNKIDTTSGNATAYKMGEFRPYSSTMLVINTPIVYRDGTTIKPDDLRNQNLKCPFPEKLIRTFTKGRILTFGICLGFALVSLALTAYIWKRWWNISTSELKEKHEISLQDYIVEFTICIEFFQFAAMGPSTTAINSFLAKISDSFSFAWENIFDLKNGMFWIVVDAVFGAIILWVILCLTILLRLDEKFRGVSLFRFLAWLADYLMPILGDLCFIPFISMCLNIFVCDQSIGDNFTDSFLAQDCYYFCWKDDHLIYAIFSFIALLCYQPFAVFCRPLWQELQNTLHIETSPLFLMVKTIVQITFIVLNKTVKRAESSVHGAIFSFIMAIYIWFIFRCKPYNYPRLCWWQALSLIGVLWLSLLSTISLIAGGYYLIYFILACAGWGIIGLIGIYVQRKKYPSLLYRKEALNTSILFTFAFSFGKNSQNALSKIVQKTTS